ncbi:alanine racemase [Streptosporangium sp. NPDC000396]|uniref:alanine racemase n=1 Tax=Streptosporangium sp. NPDC000396 TaxID=3366185 RepID=UPI0036A07FE0
MTDTPALVVDLDIVEANIAEMAAVAERHAVRLRPHAKAHKMPDLARLQLDAGAAGITCAKLGEAEVMADAGFDDILLAYPVVGPLKLDRLRALRERARVRVSLDSVEVAEGLSALGGIEVLVEVDTGLGRLGRPPGEPTARLVRDIARIPGIEVVGLLTHAGHSYRAADPRAAAVHEVSSLVETAGLCRDLGLREISVGSTPTARHAAAVPGVTEIRPGAYVFNDGMTIRAGAATEDTVAARVVTTVVARPAPDRFVVDAGSKTLGAGEGTAVAGRPDLTLAFLSDEHGVWYGEGPQIGDRLELIPFHICPVVNLFDVAAGTRGGEVVQELPIAARGRVA